MRVGGRTLGTALAALQRAGVCVTLGVSAAAEVTFDARQFFVAGRATLYGLYLFTELGSEPAAVGLRRLAELVATGKLTPHVSVELPWKDIGQVAQDLMARRFPGKAVPHPRLIMLGGPAPQAPRTLGGPGATNYKPTASATSRASSARSSWATPA